VENESPASVSALMAAAARAAHSLVDDPPHLLVDDVASRICRSMPASPLDYHLAHPREPVLAAARLSACARAKFAADALRASRLSECVLLAAGLDQLAGLDPGARCWAVDLPDVLAWRARVCEQAMVADPCRAVPADLAGGDLLARLVASGLDPGRPVFVAWLGGSMYLPASQARAVLEQLAGLPAGTALVFDHILPARDRDAAGRRYAQALAGAMGGREPWRCVPSPDEVTGWLADAGWRVARSVDEAQAVPAGFWDRRDALHPMRLVRLLHAVR